MSQKAATEDSQRNPKLVEGTMHVVSSMPLLNKRRLFRLRGHTLECISLESDLIIARFDMSDCEVKTEKDTLVLQMPNAVPVILQPPAEDYEKWKNVLRQCKKDSTRSSGGAQVKVEPRDQGRTQIKSDAPPPQASAEEMILQAARPPMAPPPPANAESMIQQLQDSERFGGIQTGDPGFLAPSGPADAKQRALENQRKAQEMAKKVAAERQQMQAKLGINPTAKPARRKYIAKKYIIAKQLREEMAKEAKQKMLDRTRQEAEFRHQMLQQLQKEREEEENMTQEERAKRAALFQQATEADLKARQAAAMKLGPAAAMMMGPMGMMGPLGFIPKPPPGPPGPLSKPKPPVRPLPWVSALSKLELPLWTTVQRPLHDLLARFPTIHPAPDLVSMNCHYATAEIRGAIQVDPLVETLTLDYKKEILAPAAPVEPTTTAKGKKFVVKVALMCGKLLNLKTHPSNQIQFVVINKPGQPDLLPEGVWTKKVDGTALKETAVRVVREMFGADISGRPIHRFLDFKYSTAEGEVQCIVMVPDIWSDHDPPLTLGKLMKEEEEEVQVMMTVDEPLKPEDIEAQRKVFREQIERMRAQGRMVRQGEREMDRIDRLERLEEEIKKLEKNPDIKETKPVTKQVPQKRKVRKEASKPTLMSLHQMMDQPLPKDEGPRSVAQFEAKMFAHCFMEMIKLEMGLKIVEYMPQYRERARLEVELSNNKRKRDSELMREWEETNKERQAKRQKRMPPKPPAPSAARTVLREADRLEAELMEQERQQKDGAPAPAEVAEPEDEEMPEPDLPPLKLTQHTYELDEAACKPFTYFDSSTGPPVGTMERTQLLHIFHRTAPRCQREVQGLVEAGLTAPAAPHAPSELMFPYRSACSVQKEVDPAAEAQKAAEALKAAAEAKVAAVEAERQREKESTAGAAARPFPAQDKNEATEDIVVDMS